MVREAYFSNQHQDINVIQPPQQKIQHRTKHVVVQLDRLLLMHLKPTQQEASQTITDGKCPDDWIAMEA